MAKQIKARLDTKGLKGLGLEKLVEILIDEAASNKALKARLLTALAGSSGPDEIARLIDKRLDTVESARTSINSARARSLALELQALMRNIQSELAAVDPYAAFERLVRLLASRTGIEQRLKADSARLAKVYSEIEAAIAVLAPSLSDDDQLKAVPALEKQRRRDRYGEHRVFFGNVLCALGGSAASAWQALLEAQLPAVDPSQTASQLLQRLFLSRGDFESYIALETRKPENRQDSFRIARMLYEAGRPEEAFGWVRKLPAGMRIIDINGTAMSVGPDYQARERKLLQADILDQMKERDAAQKLRWSIFLETFDADVLRRYITRLDDFAEFDELDKAFAAVLASRLIYEALMFLVEWPKLDLASRYVIEHAKKWDGEHDEHLLPAAEALGEAYPVAATILYRALLTYILDRAIVTAYDQAASYMRNLATLSLRLPENPPFKDHAAYVGDLQVRHPRKYGFWQRVPGIGA